MQLMRHMYMPAAGTKLIAALMQAGVLTVAVNKPAMYLASYEAKYYILNINRYIYCTKVCSYFDKMIFDILQPRRTS